MLQRKIREVIMDNFKKWDALHTTLPFGKYKGEIIETVLTEDPSYLQWLLEISIQGALLESLETIKEDIAQAVALERENELGAWAGFPDPVYD